MAETGITIFRVFDAPRERVWQEWTEPERFADWFGGPEWEVPMSTVSMDVRPGGSWQLAMFAGSGRREIHWKGEYREVVEPERLVFTVSDQPGRRVYELITVVLTDLGDGRTEMHFEQSGGTMPPEEYERAGQGWSRLLRPHRGAPGRRLTRAGRAVGEAMGAPGLAATSSSSRGATRSAAARNRTSSAARAAGSAPPCPARSSRFRARAGRGRG